MISVYLKNNMTERIGVFGRNIPTTSMDSMEEISDNLVNELKARAPTWRNYLKNSVKKEQVSKNSIVINMADYATEVDQGHIVTYNQATSAKFQEWAREIIGPYGGSVVMNMIGRMTNPHPFITPSMVAVKPRVHPILRRHLLNAKWRSGLR